MTENNDQSGRVGAGIQAGDTSGDGRTTGDEEYRKKVRAAADKVIKANREVLHRLASK